MTSIPTQVNLGTGSIGLRSNVNLGADRVALTCGRYRTEGRTVSRRDGERGPWGREALDPKHATTRIKRMGRKYGFSFSWKRATGISGAKGRISRKTGIPLTRSGRQRKVGRMMTDGKCFVATACCGSADHEDVATLRGFRDTVLRRHNLGRRFIAWYYHYGPVLATAIDTHPCLRIVCRYAVALLAVVLRRLGAFGR